jgi:hypothetical protein
MHQGAAKPKSRKTGDDSIALWCVGVGVLALFVIVFCSGWDMEYHSECECADEERGM